MIEDRFVARIQLQEEINARRVGATELPTLGGVVPQVTESPGSFRRRHAHLKLARKRCPRIMRQPEFLHATQSECDIRLGAGKFIFAAAALGRGDLTREMTEPTLGGFPVC